MIAAEIERELATALVRKYPEPPISRKEVIREYTVASKVLQRHFPSESAEWVIKLFGSYVHILTYPTPRFIRLFGKLRGDSDDITR